MKTTHKQAQRCTGTDSDWSEITEILFIRPAESHGKSTTGGALGRKTEKFLKKKESREKISRNSRSVDSIYCSEHIANERVSDSAPRFFNKSMISGATFDSVVMLPPVFEPT